MRTTCLSAKTHYLQYMTGVTGTINATHFQNYLDKWSSVKLSAISIIIENDKPFRFETMGKIAPPKSRASIISRVWSFISGLWDR